MDVYKLIIKCMNACPTVLVPCFTKPLNGTVFSLPHPTQACLPLPLPLRPYPFFGRMREHNIVFMPVLFCSVQVQDIYANCRQGPLLNSSNT